MSTAVANTLAEHAADIVRAIAELISVKGPTVLGISALLILILAGMGIFLLKDAQKNVKAAIYVLMLLLAATSMLAGPKIMQPQISACLSFIGLPICQEVAKKFTWYEHPISSPQSASNHPWTIHVSPKNNQEATFHGTWWPNYNITDGIIKGDTISFHVAVNDTRKELHASGTCEGEVVQGTAHDFFFADQKAGPDNINWEIQKVP